MWYLIPKETGKATEGANVTGTIWDIVPILLIGAVMLLVVWVGNKDL